jgi:hypothetical protein
VTLLSVAALAKALGEGSFAGIYFDNLNWEAHDYNARLAHHQTKLANHLHALEALRKAQPTIYSNLDVHVFKKTIGDARLVCNTDGQHHGLKDYLVER